MDSKSRERISIALAIATVMLFVASEYVPLLYVPLVITAFACLAIACRIGGK